MNIVMFSHALANDVLISDWYVNRKENRHIKQTNIIIYNELCLILLVRRSRDRAFEMKIKCIIQKKLTTVCLNSIIIKFFFFFW